MKQIHHIRLLYGVVIVLTTSLLIVGGAYRVKVKEANALRSERERDIRNANTESERLSSVIDAYIDGQSQNRLYIRDLEARLKAYESVAKPAEIGDLNRQEVVSVTFPPIMERPVGNETDRITGSN